MDTIRSLTRSSLIMALGVALASCSAPAPGAVADEAQQAAATSSVPLAPALVVGARAPEFTLPDQDNKPHSLSDYRGKIVVLAFYPADMSRGCTIEAHNLTESLNEFDKRGVQVLGISVQDVASKKKFCETAGIKYPLLADVDKTVVKAYNVLSERGVAQRVSYIIAPDGTIGAIDNNVKVATHAADLLAQIAAGRSKWAAASPATAQAPAFVTLDKAVAPFTLANYDGKDVTVGNWNADGRKATLVLFVSTKCPVSNGYNDRMEALSKDYSARGLRVIAVNSNVGQPPAAIAAHARAHHFDFPVLKDNGAVVADKFKAEVTPEAYLIDDKGVLRYHGRIDDSLNAAAITKHDLRAAIDAQLAGKTVENKETQAFGCGIKRG